jgi:acyl carrier protein
MGVGASTALEQLVYPVAAEFDEFDTTQLEPETRLWGDGAPLDSLGLLAFLAAVEDRIDDERGISLRLLSDDAMSSTRSPFNTLGSLAAYVDERIMDVD